ncbi:MAG: hypothetical protein ACREJ4_14910 [Candidatus Methylomirabilaceae bacterium]
MKSEGLFFRVRDAPGQNTVAHELLQGGTASDRPTDVAADEWIEGRRGSRYSVREHSIMSAGGVLTLLWWKDERIFTNH